MVVVTISRVFQVWLTEGRLEDWAGEYIFYKTAEAVEGTEDYWDAVFRSREWEARLEEEGIPALKLLQPDLHHKILVSGKSVEIFSCLERSGSSARPGQGDTSTSRPLYTEFIENLAAALPASLNAQANCGERQEQAGINDPALQAIVDNAEDPHLALAFQEVFLAAEAGHRTGAECGAGQNWRAGLVLPNCAPDPLLPLGPVLQRALAPAIRRHYTTACTALTALFRDQLQLEAVLRRARQVSW